MSSVSHNNMGPVQPANDEAKAIFHEVKEETVKLLHKLKHDDQLHGLHRMDNLKTIDTFILREFATEEVAYGINYFGKIEIDEGKFIHVRAHKNQDGNIELYSIYTLPERAVFDESEPLKYFTD